MLLYTDACSILDGNLVALCDAVSSMESKESYGTILFDHLAADGAGFAGGQVTVVTVGQIDADLGSGLHLELVHSLTGLGNIQLVVVIVAHIDSLLFVFPESKMLSGLESVFSFRSHSLTKGKRKNHVSFRKSTQKMGATEVTVLDRMSHHIF